jgi:hypothetical protein
LRLNVHIDRSQSTVGDGATDGTSKGESGVELQTGQLAWSIGSGEFDASIDLVGDRRRHDETSIKIKKIILKKLSGEG